MKIINYITFENNEDFGKWQTEDERQITSVSPLMMELDIGMKENEVDISGNANVTTGVFVVYLTGE